MSAYHPGTPPPGNRQLEPACPAINIAVMDLIDLIMEHYPEEAESISRGVQVRIATPDQKCDHVFRLRLK